MLFLKGRESYLGMCPNPAMVGARSISMFFLPPISPRHCMRRPAVLQFLLTESKRRGMTAQWALYPADRVGKYVLHCIVPAEVS